MPETEGAKRDLVVLVADKNMEAALRGILARHESIGCRPFSHQVFSHPHRDPGCLAESHTFLGVLRHQYSHALVVFDREGCGNSASAADIAKQVEHGLRETGWTNRSAAIVIDPELEAWVWSPSPHVSTTLGWTGVGSLRDWLAAKNAWPAESAKPPRPKESLEAVLRHTRRVRSSSVYRDLAERVSLAACIDPAFARLKLVLRSWFPVTPAGCS
jgi:hypothetical protein